MNVVKRLCVINGTSITYLRRDIHVQGKPFLPCTDINKRSLTTTKYKKGNTYRVLTAIT